MEMGNVDLQVPSVADDPPRELYREIYLGMISHATP